MESIIFMECINRCQPLSSRSCGNDGLGTIYRSQLTTNARFLREFHGSDVTACTQWIIHLRCLVPISTIPRIGKHNELPLPDELICKLLRTGALDNRSYPLTWVTHFFIP